MKVPAIDANTPVTIGLLVSVAASILYVASAWGQVQANVSDLLGFKKSTEQSIKEMEDRTARIETKLDFILGYGPKPAPAPAEHQ